VEFQLPCACGKPVTVTEGAAGGSVSCSCGRVVAVPSLRELRARAPAATDHATATTAPRRKLAQYIVWYLGVLLFALGILVLIGNRTGFCPTFPFAGLLLMGAGLVLIRAGNA
jgi:hypothetical protein